MISKSDLRRIDLNLVESLREFARWNDASAVTDRAGLLFVTGGPASEHQTLRVDRGIPAAEALRRMRAFFAEIGGGFTLRTRAEADPDIDALLAEQGLSPLRSTPWMRLDHPLEERPLPAGAELRIARAEEDFRAIADINAEAYADLGNLPQASRERYQVARRALEPHIHSVVAYVSGEPAATAMTFLSHGIGGIYWVGTLGRHRRRGLAEACTRAVGNWAFEQGAAFVALHASPMGVPVYRRMGFECVSTHRRYRIPAAEPEPEA
ncbi:MAG: GNAT family N-acetyltransferase [Proteobacteria bacterium]|nr:GNAT family N-acetyltransferase [Pseudomonadota bacterium]